jgi:thioredoxin-like negative regulator of GroEL
MMVIGCSQNDTGSRTDYIVEEGVAPYYTTMESALAAAQESDRYVAVDFYTDWCYWCKVIDTAVYEHESGIDFFTNRMILAKVNAEVDTVAAEKYAVSAYPTIVLVDAEGNEVDRLIGFAPVEEFVQTLEDYTKGIGTLDDLLAQAETSADRDLYYRIADKYKYRGMPEPAETWYQKVIDNGDAIDSLSGESRIAIADMYRRAKDYGRAIETLKRVEKDFGDSSHGQDAIIWQGIVYKQAGDTADAIARFEAFAARYPDSEDVEYALGQIQQLKNLPPEATQ